MSIIDTLEQEHQALKELFTELRELGVTSPEGRKKLSKSKSLLISHLQKEDQQLYPKLSELAETKKIANSFESEMKEITTSVLAFYEKYESNDIDSQEFARDVGKILGALNARIRKEEITLYPAYRKHVL